MAGTPRSVVIGRAPANVREWQAASCVPKRALSLLQMLRLPTHRGEDAFAAAWMIEEEDLLHRPGTHLAVFAEVQRGLRKSVRLVCGIEPIHVRLRFLHPDDRVDDRSENEEEERGQQDDERQRGRIADAAQAEASAPAFERPTEREAQRNEPEDDD